MSLNRHPRNAKRGTIWVQTFVASIALFALLVIRNAPPDFPKPSSLHHCSINAVSSHDQRPRFNAGGLEWSAPVSHFLSFPPAAESARLTPVSQLSSPLQTKGFHYNRPPPAS